LLGILCKHALKIFNIKDVFVLPSKYILNRWTKYAKREFFVEKHGINKENLTTQAARISRKATSVALKCSLSKELLDDLEKAIDKLNLDADNAIMNVQEKDNEVPPVSAYCSTDTLTGKISFRVSRVVKGPKKKRSTTSLEKRKGKKNRSASKNKGDDPKQTLVRHLPCINYIISFLYCVFTYM
jgi:nucleotidyltransferase/DNA polymerase involved in DNA repair